MSRRRRLPSLCIVALAACLPPPRAWLPTEPAFVAASAGFELVPPPGWMRWGARQEGLVLTRDGPSLQRIVVDSDAVAGFRPDLTSEAYAELVLAQLRAAERLADVRLVEGAPASLSGRAAFRIVAEFRSASGLPCRGVVYGLVDAGRPYRLFYLAPVRHYFDRDLPVFEELVRSFRLRPPGATPG